MRPASDVSGPWERSRFERLLGIDFDAAYQELLEDAYTTVEEYADTEGYFAVEDDGLCSGYRPEHSDRIADLQAALPEIDHDDHERLFDRARDRMAELGYDDPGETIAELASIRSDQDHAYPVRSIRNGLRRALD